MESLLIFITWVAQVLCSQLLLGLERIKHWNRSLLLEILSQPGLTVGENNCFSTFCMDSVFWFQLWLAFHYLPKQSSSHLWEVAGCQCWMAWDTLMLIAVCTSPCSWACCVCISSQSLNWESLKKTKYCRIGKLLNILSSVNLKLKLLIDLTALDCSVWVSGEKF